MQSSMGDYDYHYQNSLKQKLQETLDRMSNERDDNISYKLEMEAKFLASKINLVEDEKISIEELIKQTKENKKNLRASRQYQMQTNSYYNRLNDPRLLAQRHYDPTVGFAGY